jgi:chromosome segregation ATPase
MTNPNLQAAGGKVNQTRYKTSEEKIAEAIQQLQLDGVTVTPTSVANRSGVARATVYRHQELLDEVTDLRDKAQRLPPAHRLLPADHVADYQQMHARYLAAQATINQLQEQIAALEATTDQALLTSGASSKPSPLKRAEDRVAELTVEHTNDQQGLRSKENRILDLEEELDSIRILNQEFVTENTALSQQIQSLRQEATTRNLRSAGTAKR